MTIFAVTRRSAVCLCWLACTAAACSLGDPTMGEYASVTNSTAAGAGAAGEGDDPQPSNPGGSAGDSSAGDGGSADSLGAGGDPGSGGGSEAAGTSGTAGSVGAAGGAGTLGGAGTGGTGNTGGTSGATGSTACADHPIGSRSKWVASASSASSGMSSSAVLDGSSSRWTTGQPQSGNEWLQIDFGTTVSIRRINLQQGSYANDYPRSYAVYVSNAPHDSSGPPCATGVGASDVTTTIVLPKPFTGRYLLIRQKDSSLSWWSVEEVEVSCFEG